ncbi:hypothetical protein Zmor_023649 [Zophobas morio]|uniref:Uncharacterized protein n=1 Tax=Zophobas morio TaxID=2755281 RepID=A0AA38HYI2_9CUCU|nr:hypothetical protein Zmor_023649 [Zophobas morio]
MCLCKDLPEMVCKPRSPRSPWRRHQREIVKPRLSRKIVSSARVNLNCHWAKFEEIADMVKITNRPSLDNEINENLANEIRELGN